MRFANEESFENNFEGKVDPFLLSAFWQALDASYFRRFNREAIALHLEMLQNIHLASWQMQINQLKSNQFQIIWVGPDKLGFFALLSGIIAGSGHSIVGGDLYSFELDPQDAALAGNDTLYNKPIALDVLEFRGKGKLEEVRAQIEELFDSLYPDFKKQSLNGIRPKLQYLIGGQLSKNSLRPQVSWIPLDIQFRNTTTKTHLLVNGQDSHAFLFILSIVLSMRGLNIRSVKIRTRGQRLLDRISLVDRQGKPILQASTQEAVRRDVLIVKQFIHYLDQASDYQTAFQNFFQLLQKSKDEMWDDELIDLHDFFSKLAKILGTGTFLWEEFSRLQFKELRPIFANDDALKRTYSHKQLETIIDGILNSDPFTSSEEKVKTLNVFKNKELFRLDLKHLVFNDNTFEDFSKDLGILAEVSLVRLYEIGYDYLESKYGTPILDGDKISGALLALGKFGGQELGYASDLELVFVYEGTGQTEGAKNTISNQEFFNKLVQWVNKSWSTKSDGIFEIDWRLRPYGEKGSWSVSLEFWKNYYLDEQKAHSIEVQAMCKMRSIAGGKWLRNECESFRDHVVYDLRQVDKEGFLKMRHLQIDSHVNSNSINAKYSPGGLVDIEYSIQYIQMEKGGQYPELRETNVLRVMRAMLNCGVIHPTLFEKLNNAYAFFRRLINALRIVRGNAKDLELPKELSTEWEFLERRMGYYGAGQNPYGASLKEDLNYHLGQVSLWYDENFHGMYHEILHRGGLPELLSGQLDIDNGEKVLAHLGVQDFERSLNLLKRIYDFANDQESLMSILVVAARNIRNSASPEGVLHNLERFMSHGEENERFFRRLLENPEVLRQMILIFSTSNFLSGVIEQSPEVLFELNESQELWKKKARSELAYELSEQYQPGWDLNDCLEHLRKFRNIEYLRIFLRDIDQHVAMHLLVEEISDLTLVIAEHVFEKVFQEAELSHLLDCIEVIALGKLGAKELNYSSDIDLVYLWNEDEIKSDDKYQCEKLLRKAMRLMTATSQYGQLFRVDTALRPHGQQGGLIATRKHYMDYYLNHAQGWELQAWLKASPFWGRESGWQVIHKIHLLLLDESRVLEIEKSIKKMRLLVLERNRKHKIDEREVKNGVGGLRTLEFFFQKKSMEWGKRPDYKLSGNSLGILYHARRLELITKENYEQWSTDYIFLRKVEHLLQVDNLQQRHLIPDSPKEIEVLSRKMGFRARLDKSASHLFSQKLQDVQTRNTIIHEEMFK